MSNWLDDFDHWARNAKTVPLFRRWAGVMALSGALQRRRWLSFAGGTLYPNLFVIMVAAPASGKSQALNKTKRVLRAMTTSASGMLPDSLTKAALIDNLAARFHNEHGLENVWNGGTLITDELSVLMSVYDKELISHLVSFWNCDDDQFQESRRHAEHKQVTLVKPYLAMFAGVQSTVLGTFLPDHAWSQGFCSRTIFSFSPDGVQLDSSMADLPAARIDDTQTVMGLAGRLDRLCEERFEFFLEPEAHSFLKDWLDRQCKPSPIHTSLQDYNMRRWLQVIKISMIRATGENARRLSAEHLFWSKTLLEESEHYLPEFFAALKRQTHEAIMEDAANFILAAYARNEARGQKHVKKAELVEWLVRRVDVRTLDAHIETMKMGGVLDVVGALADGTEMYRPGKYAGSWTGGQAA